MWTDLSCYGSHSYVKEHFRFQNTDLAVTFFFKATLRENLKLSWYIGRLSLRVDDSTEKGWRLRRKKGLIQIREEHKYLKDEERRSLQRWLI